MGATGSPEPTYQWQFDGVPIPGATGSTYTLSNVGTTQAGSYSVGVESGGISATSSAATITVNTGGWLTNLSARAYYRRQMSKHHPDKLQSQGLPESMLERAKERTQQIQAAYELLCKQRGMP